MALINCYECGVSISDRANTCPECGAPVSKPASPEATDKSTLITTNKEVSEAIANTGPKAKSGGTMGFLWLGMAIGALILALKGGSLMIWLVFLWTMFATVYHFYQSGDKK